MHSVGPSVCLVFTPQAWSAAMSLLRRTTHRQTPTSALELLGQTPSQTPKAERPP